MSNISINISDIVFEGPFPLRETNFNDVPAIYVILNGPVVSPVDVGETDKLRGRLSGHKRTNCWIQNCPQGIYVAVRIEGNKERRLELESFIRNSYNLPCGEK